MTIFNVSFLCLMSMKQFGDGLQENSLNIPPASCIFLVFYIFYIINIHIHYLSN